MDFKTLFPNKKHRYILIAVSAAALIGLVLLLLILSAPGDIQQTTGTTHTTAQTISPETTEPSAPPTTEQTLPEETLPPQTTEDAQDPQNTPTPKPQGSGATVELTPSVIEGAKENDQLTLGIDVSKYQGTIDWAQVAAAGIDFAMIRVGYRTLVSGEIIADPNAKYNLQQAHKYGIRLGAYFFSTAISAPEAAHEANWVADLISRYPITYPVAYNCEGFQTPENRQYTLTKTQRTDIALTFLKTLQQRGYTPMFYASSSDLQTQWETSRIDGLYKIWVAQYPAQPYPQTASSAYSGKHAMWQYTGSGTIAGISKKVDVNIAYFGYDSAQNPQNPDTPEDVTPDVEALMTFSPVDESVTAKAETNLRDRPSQGADSQVLHTLLNGQVAKRIGISSSGWSKLEYNGSICYAVSSLLTTDLTPAPTEPDTPDTPAIQTQFTPVNEQVTAKDAVNLRSMPSTTNENSVVVAQLKHGQVITRTGINTDVGWSRVVYEGHVLYCISSYLQPAEQIQPTEAPTTDQTEASTAPEA